MPIKYDRLFSLMKQQNISTYTLRKEKFIGEKTLQAMREGKPIRTDILCRFCERFICQPGDLMEYVKAETNGE